MKNKFAPLLLSLALLPYAGIQGALAEDISNDHFSKKTANGVTVTQAESSDVSLSKSGEQTSNLVEKKVVDPQGLMNKTSSEKHTTLTTKPDGDFSKTETTNHLDGTEEIVTAEQKTSQNWTDKGKTTTTTTTNKKVIDPRGLGNKSSVEVTQQVETNPQGAEKTTITKRIDGAIVTEDSKTTR
jgi:hypothetical protein